MFNAKRVLFEVVISAEPLYSVHISTFKQGKTQLIVTNLFSLFGWSCFQQFNFIAGFLVFIRFEEFFRIVFKHTINRFVNTYRLSQY